MNLGGTVISAALHIGVFTIITRGEPAEPPPKATRIRVMTTEPKPIIATKVEPDLIVKAEHKARPKAKAQSKTEPEPGAEPRPTTPGAPVDLSNLTLSNDNGSGPTFPGGSEELRDSEPRPKPAPKAKAPAQKPKSTAPSCEEDVVKATPTSKVPIEYPQAARELGLEGQVILRAQIGSDGTVLRVEVLRSAGEIIDQAAMKALEKWEFAPATKCGKSTEGTFTISRRFEMGT